jgi:PAS domain S-box-containing protein
MSGNCRESDRKNRFLVSVVEQSDDIIVFKDLDLRVVATNTAFARAAGYSSPEDLVGRTDAEIYGMPPDTEPVRTYMEDERKAQKLPPGCRILREEPLPTASGETRYVLTEKYPIYDENGLLIGTGSISRDVTERRIAEEALRKSEDRYRTLADDLHLFICEFLPDGGMTYANRMLCEDLGKPWEELAGRSFLNRLPEDIREEERRKFLSLTPEQPYGVSVRKVLRNGEHRWREWRRRAFFDENGTPLFYRSVGIDVTERESMEEALRTAKENAERLGRQAEAASRAKSAFLANTGHELRTPLNGVIGFLDLLSRTTLDPTQRDWLESASASSQSLLDVVENVLDISRIEADNLGLEPVRTDILDILNKAASIVRNAAEQKGLSLSIRVGRDVPCNAVVDPARLRQVLVNLLGNAVKFTEKGSVELSLEFEAIDAATGAFTFSVGDTGIGIGEEQRRRIFEPFYQIDSSFTRRYGGTGLGLSICGALLRMMESSLEVESVPGEGSRFFFTLRTEWSDSRRDASRAGEGKKCGPHPISSFPEDGSPKQ